MARESQGGPEAQLAAALDAQRRRDRSAGRAALQAADKALTELDQAASLLLQAALLGAGFQQHDRGAWRRRRK
jgi:hypothetical protein